MARSAAVVAVAAGVMPRLHQDTCRPETCIPDEQLVSGYIQGGPTKMIPTWFLTSLDLKNTLDYCDDFWQFK